MRTGISLPTFPANRLTRPDTMPSHLDSPVCVLALEDGRSFIGRAFGALGEVDGEACFNTSMSGYQEILTDPSYRGQIVAMTYPQIGNYGISALDAESRGVHMAGFVIRELCDQPSNYRSELSLNKFLLDAGVMGVQGIDTRALVRHLRIRGSMKAVLSTLCTDPAVLCEKARVSPGLVGRDLVREVSPTASYSWTDGLEPLARNPWERLFAAAGQFPIGSASGAGSPNDAASSPALPGDAMSSKRQPHVVAIDYGMKWNIARHLADLGCRLTIVPATTTAEQVLAHKPDGVFLSNGPGDPRPLTYAIETIRGVLGKVPVFGICLGQQLLGLAAGGEIYKLKFGHRGANQPVLDKRSGRVEITTQNHGFSLATESLPERVEVTHVNLNDQTPEGIRFKDVPAFAVQYHPEAAAGPHDSQYLFREFLDMMAV